MTATLVDACRHLSDVTDDLPTLGDVLLQLVGEPFLFARAGYADELSLHFGTLRDAKHPRLRARGIKYGSHALYARGSAWLLKSGPNNLVILEGLPTDPIAHLGQIGRKIETTEIETRGIIPPGSPVVAVAPFYVEQVEGMGLRVETADGSGIVIIPTPKNTRRRSPRSSLPATPARCCRRRTRPRCAIRPR